MSLQAPILSIRSFRVSRGGVEVVNVEELDIEKGSHLTLIGPNGAGKSSLLLAIAGLIEPSSGTIVFRGEKVSHKGDMLTYRRSTACIFQEGKEPDITLQALGMDVFDPNLSLADGGGQEKIGSAGDVAFNPAAYSPIALISFYTVMAGSCRLHFHAKFLHGHDGHVDIGQGRNATGQFDKCVACGVGGGDQEGRDVLAAFDVPEDYRAPPQPRRPDKNGGITFPVAAAPGIDAELSQGLQQW